MTELPSYVQSFEENFANKKKLLLVTRYTNLWNLKRCLTIWLNKREVSPQSISHFGVKWRNPPPSWKSYVWLPNTATCVTEKDSFRMTNIFIILYPLGIRFVSQKYPRYPTPTFVSRKVAFNDKAQYHPGTKNVSILHNDDFTVQ